MLTATCVNQRYRKKVQAFEQLRWPIGKSIRLLLGLFPPKKLRCTFSRCRCGRSGVHILGRSNRHSVATAATFLRSCVAQALSRGDRFRHSLRASAYSREYNVTLVRKLRKSFFGKIEFLAPISCSAGSASNA